MKCSASGTDHLVRLELAADHDLCDDDVERNAILASLVDSLVQAFNYRYELGSQRGGPSDKAPQTTADREEICPPWVSVVEPLRDPLVLSDQEGFVPGHIGK